MIGRLVYAFWKTNGERSLWDGIETSFSWSYRTFGLTTSHLGDHDQFLAKW